MRPAIVVVSALLLVTPAASAQDWEVEVHGGWQASPDVSGGSGSLPPVGATFVTPPFTSRQVPSWLFGDGARLLNEIAAALGFNIPQRITPLDGVANNLLARRSSGGSVGFRVSRRLTRRLGAEFNFDYARASWEERDGVSAGLDATTSTFRSVFESNTLLPTAIFVGKAVTTANALALGDASDMSATGAVSFNLLTAGRVIPYVTAGAGVVNQRGDTPEATAAVGYTFRFDGVSPFDERDTVHLRQVVDDSVVVGVFSGGVRMDLTPRSGLRVDVRAHVGRATDRVLLSATPAVIPGNPFPLFPIYSFTNPSMSFNNIPIANPFPPSNLSAPAVADFTSFEVESTRTRVMVSVGYYFRF